MSRTKKGSKSVGYEYWSKRPLSNAHGVSPGRIAKTLTHKIERAIAKRDLNREINQD